MWTWTNVTSSLIAAERELASICRAPSSASVTMMNTAAPCALSKILAQLRAALMEAPALLSATIIRTILAYAQRALTVTDVNW